MRRGSEPIDTRHLFAPERQALLNLLEHLEPDRWHAPTVCEGWSVHDVALHILWGDLSLLARRRDEWFGRPQDAPESIDDLPSLIAFIDRLNDSWLRGARRLSPRIVCTLLHVYGEELATFVQSWDLDALGSPVGWAGPEPAPVWLDLAREFSERWVHQQHIRDAVGIPGATETAFLRPVLAAFMYALPFALREVTGRVGDTMRVTIAGDAGGTWQVVRQPETWKLEGPTATLPAAALELDQDLAWRLFTKGVSPSDARSRVDASGDPGLIDAALRTVAILA
jgi:uncharacterized protein (TIGR03083 family)